MDAADRTRIRRVLAERLRWARACMFKAHAEYMQSEKEDRSQMLSAVGVAYGVLSMALHLNAITDQEFNMLFTHWADRPGDKISVD